MTDYRQQWLDAQAKSWDSQLEFFARVANRHPADMLKVILNWDLMERLVNPLRLPTDALTSRYSIPSDLCETLWWLGFFVGHEIHDDGEPALIWYKRQKRPAYFGKDEPIPEDALPILFQAIEPVPTLQGCAHYIGEVSLLDDAFKALRREQDARDAKLQQKMEIFLRPSDRQKALHEIYHQVVKPTE